MTKARTIPPTAPPTLPEDETTIKQTMSTQN